MKISGYLGLALLYLVLGLLSGCAWEQESKEDIQQLREETDLYLDQIDRQAQSTVAMHQSDWIRGEEFVIAESLPDVLKESRPYSTATPMSLYEIAESLTEDTEIPVVISANVFGNKEGAQGAGAESEQAGEAITFQHDGTVISFLDKLCARFGLIWEYTNDRVVISKTKTEVFYVHILPGTTQFDGSIGGSAPGDTGVGGGATANQNFSFKQEEHDRWEDILETIEGLLSPIGALYAARSTGSITVSDTPEVLSVVGNYIERENISLTRQIMIDVKALSWTIGDDSDMNLDLTTLFNDSRLSIASAAGLPAAAGGTAARQLVSGILIDTGSNYAGTRAVFDALTSRADISIVTSAQLITLNHQPVPIQVTETEGYLAEVETTVTAGGVGNFAQTSLTPGQVVTGFIMTATPRLLSDDRILLRTALDISQLLGFEVASSGQNSISIPNVERRALVQEFMVRSGQTLILSGFESANDLLAVDAQVASWNPFSARRKRHSSTRLVLLMTPSLIGNASGAQLR